MKFIKGMAAGLAVGACVGMVLAPDKKRRRRQFNKAVNAVEQAIEDFRDSVKF